MAIQTGPSFGFHGTYDLPTLLVSLESICLAVLLQLTMSQSHISAGIAYMTCCDDLAFAIPDQAHEWEKLGADADYRQRWLFWSTRIHDSDAAIMRRKCQSIATGGKRASMHPPGGVIQILAAYGIEWQSLTPHTGLRPLIGPFDEGREYPRMSVC